MLGIGPGVRRGDGLKAVALLHFTHPSSTSSRRKPGPMPSQQNCNAACFMPARTTFPSMLTCPAPDQAALLPIINSKDREMITLSGRSISSTKEQICLILRFALFIAAILFAIHGAVDASTLTTRSTPIDGKQCIDISHDRDGMPNACRRFVKSHFERNMIAVAGWRPYSGAPHDHHMHVSIKAEHRNVTKAWPWPALES
jgi:hypothetical protein